MLSTVIGRKEREQRKPANQRPQRAREMKIYSESHAGGKSAIFKNCALSTLQIKESYKESPLADPQNGILFDMMTG